MSKRTIALLTLLAVFAFSLLGVYTLNADTSPENTPVDTQTHILEDNSWIQLASDEPLCPINVPPPC
jgi:hypothetical protein